MDHIEILENRILQLEKLIFGPQGRPKEDVIPETTIIDSVCHANTLITSALAGRENLNALIKRLPELEALIEAKADPGGLDNKKKLEYILAMEPEIREYAKQAKQFKELSYVLDSDRFRDLPELSEKLHKLNIKYIKMSEETNAVTEATKTMISRYNEIMTNISKLLINLDAEVTRLEKASEPKKEEEDEE